MKIAIVGRKADTTNYEHYVLALPATPIVTLSPGELSGCDGLILPGGGDINPSLFGEQNTASRNIDTELDILQLQALEYALSHSLPILGICKGMQIINVAFGGTITQHLPTAELHRYREGDQYHSTIISETSCLYPLYGSHLMVNSAHHQGINKIGAVLTPIQWCEADNCVEALIHETLPVLGLQWHPERLHDTTLLSYFASWIPH